MTRRAWLLLVGVSVAALMAPAVSSAAAPNERVTELISVLPDGSDLAACPYFRIPCGLRISDDGTHAFFFGVAGDGSRQIFERSKGVTKLVSTGPSAVAGTPSMCQPFSGLPCNFRISRDGSHVFFDTAQRLVAADADTCDSIEFAPRCIDVYERFGDTTRLVSTGPTGRDGPYDAALLAVSDDGSHAFFATEEPLVADDTDESNDVYEAAGNSVELFPSDAFAEGDTRDISFHPAGASPDGSRVFFSTVQSFSPADTDDCSDRYREGGCVDVYERTADGHVILVSTGPNGGNAPYDADFSGASSDGTRVFFATREPLVASDGDDCAALYNYPQALGCQDVYERDVETGTTTLVSSGPDSSAGPSEAYFEAVAADGKRVFFSTGEALAAADTDACPTSSQPVAGCLDVYARTANGRIILVSTGSNDGNGGFDAYFGAISGDGKRIFFSTAEPLVSTDTDSCPTFNSAGCTDVYERFGDRTLLVSTGPVGGNGPAGAGLAGVSGDGRRVFFTTSESLVASDRDDCSTDYQLPPPIGCPDIYERFRGTTSLLSTGPSDTGGCQPFDEGGGNCPHFLATSVDGTRVFFNTKQALVSADTNSEVDIYVSTVALPGCRPDEPERTSPKCAR
jgi:hypothetical protein